MKDNNREIRDSAMTLLDDPDYRRRIEEHFETSAKSLATCASDFRKCREHLKELTSVFARILGELRRQQ